MPILNLNQAIGFIVGKIYKLNHAPAKRLQKNTQPIVLN